MHNAIIVSIKETNRPEGDWRISYNGRQRIKYLVSDMEGKREAYRVDGFSQAIGYAKTRWELDIKKLKGEEASKVIASSHVVVPNSGIVYFTV